MKINVTSQAVVKVESYDCNVEPKSIRLSELDNVQPRLYSQGCYFYRNLDVSNCEFMNFNGLKTALIYVLKFYPELVGELRLLGDGGLEVICNNSGAYFLTAEGDFDYSECEKNGFNQCDLPDNMLPKYEDKLSDFVLKIQVTKLKGNSGAIVGFMVHHSITDGHGMFTFIRRWSKVAAAMLRHSELMLFAPTGTRNRLVGTMVKPEFSHPEYSLKQPPSPSTLKEEHDRPLLRENILQELTARNFYISRASLDGLKQNAFTAGSGVNLSTNDVLCALLWRAVTRARQLDTSIVTVLGMACNGRKRLEPPLPDDYFGNVNLYLTTRMSVNQLIVESLGYVAGCIRQSVNSMNHCRIQSAINWIACQPQKAEIIPGFRIFLGPDFAITSWVGFPLYDVDFGWGKPEKFRIPAKAFDGLAVLTAAGEDGGIEVTLGLKKAECERLLKDVEFSDAMKELSMQEEVDKQG